MREAHLRDAVALCSLLSFLEEEVGCVLYPPAPPPPQKPPSPPFPKSGEPECMTARMEMIWLYVAFASIV